jgi:hypothetical protein
MGMAEAFCKVLFRAELRIRMIVLRRTAAAARLYDLLYRPKTRKPVASGMIAEGSLSGGST